VALQAAWNRRHAARLAADHAVLQPVADDAAEALVDIRGRALHRHAAQQRNRGRRGARVRDVADQDANGERPRRGGPLRVAMHPAAWRLVERVEEFAALRRGHARPVDLALVLLA